jgi:hypothetical protein
VQYILKEAFFGHEPRVLVVLQKLFALSRHGYETTFPDKGWRSFTFARYSSVTLYAQKLIALFPSF